MPNFELPRLLAVVCILSDPQELKEGDEIVKNQFVSGKYHVYRSLATDKLSNFQLVMSESDGMRVECAVKIGEHILLPGYIPIGTNHYPALFSFAVARAAALSEDLVPRELREEIIRYAIFLEAKDED